MCSSRGVVPCLIFFVFLFFSDVSSFPSQRQIDIHGRMQKRTTITSKVEIGTFQLNYYNQTLDHFNFRPESYDTFKQKFIVNFDYWGGAHSNSPIFVMLGDEAPMSDYACVGFLTDNAPRFGALLVAIEHRFYGESRPYGLTMEQAMNNASVRGYFNSAQALADYAEVILYLKEQLNATYSPVIIFGGSYGGMLAAWFRLKYPHIAMGALASSATIVNLDGVAPKDSYCAGVTRAFKGTSQSCYETVKKSWDEIDRVASMPNGLSILSQKFNTCNPLVDAEELKGYLNNIYNNAAQYNSPELSSLCEAIDAGDENTDLLTRIYAAVVVNGDGSEACHHNISAAQDPADVEMGLGWGWQCCSEVVIPDTCGTTKDSDMYESWRDEFNLTSFTEDCRAQFNVSPRPHWLTNYYGGHDMKLIFKNFGSNIIFSNGLYDPFSGEGVLESLSDTLVAVKTEKGSHCQDLNEESPDDPSWLTDQREEEIKIIRNWIRRYHNDLKESGISSGPMSSSSEMEPRRSLTSWIGIFIITLALFVSF